MKMLVAVALGLLLSSPALAQAPEQRNEVFVGFGTCPVIFIAEDLAGIYGSVLTLGTFRYESEGSAGQLLAGYQHRFNRWVGAGVTGSWAQKSETVYFLDHNLGKVSQDMYTVVLDGRLHWVSRPSWDLYSGLGLGFALRTVEYEETGKDDSKVEAATHLTFLGARFGRGFGGFLEVGGVYNSLITVGLSSRF